MTILQSPNLSRVFVVGLLLAFLPLSAWADLSLREALERAWERALQGRMAEARRHVAAARHSAASAGFPEPPSVALAEKNDRFGHNVGLREREIELALPLWLPGQRNARMTVAAEEIAEVEATIAVDRLDLAGKLREAVWEVALAKAEADIARERLATAEKLKAEVARRVQAGDLARTDSLLAQEETLAASIALADAQNRERQAMERYRLLTGLDRLPSPREEELAPAMGEHPRLRLAQAAILRAQAEMRLAREERRNPPELSIAAIQSRESSVAANTNTLRLAIRIPFATDAHHAPKIATANAELVRAEAEYRQTLAELDFELSLAQAALAHAEAAHRAAQLRAGLATERLALQEKAFALGELALSEFMRVRAAANEARLEQLRASHLLAAARARVNQARGIMP